MLRPWLHPEVPTHAHCCLLELGLGIGIDGQEAEKLVAHLPVVRQHLLIGLLQEREPGISRLTQLHLTLGRDE